MKKAQCPFFTLFLEVVPQLKLKSPIITQSTHLSVLGLRMVFVKLNQVKTEAKPPTHYLDTFYSSIKKTLYSEKKLLDCPFVVYVMCLCISVRVYNQSELFKYP